MAKHHIYLKREGKALVPTDAISEALLEKVPEGRDLMCKTETARNVKHHRLLWVVAGIIAENSFDFENAEHVVYQLKLSTGLVDHRAVWSEEFGWTIHAIPQSIAFESMSQEHFAAWFKQALEVIHAVMLPGVEDYIREEVKQALGIDWWPDLEPV